MASQKILELLKALKSGTEAEPKRLLWEDLPDEELQRLRDRADGDRDMVDLLYFHWFGPSSPDGL